MASDPSQGENRQVSDFVKRNPSLQLANNICIKRQPNGVQIDQYMDNEVYPKPQSASDLATLPIEALREKVKYHSLADFEHLLSELDLGDSLAAQKMLTIVFDRDFEMVKRIFDFLEPSEITAQ